MTRRLAHRERDALADLALQLGEQAPTLCGDWTVKDLVVHLLVRERSPLAAAGSQIGALSRFTERSTRRWERADLPLLVDQLRRPRLTWAAVGPLDALGNTMELFVHHEDVRRAQPDWSPRPLDDADQDALWRQASLLGRLTVRSAGVPVTIRDRRTGAERTLRKASSGEGRGAIVTGDPAELLLFLVGREQVSGLAFEGDAEADERLRSSERSL